MPGLSRRLLLGAIAASTIASPVLAAEKLVDVGTVFKFLDVYLKIPPAERSHFVLAFYLTAGGKPVQGVKATLVEGPTRIPLPINAEGRFERLPTLQAFQAHAKVGFDVAAATKFGLQLSVEPVVRPGLDVDAGELARAVSQAQAGTRKAAGLIGFMVPSMERVWLRGADGAEVIFADGRRAPLPKAKGIAVFDPAVQRGARTLHFTRAPTRMEIGPAK